MGTRYCAYIRRRPEQFSAGERIPVPLGYRIGLVRKTTQEL